MNRFPPPHSSPPAPADGRLGRIALYLLILVDSISATMIVPLLAPLLIEPSTQEFLRGDSLPLRHFVSGALVATYVLMMLYVAPLLGRLSDTAALIDPLHVDALSRALLAEGHTPKVQEGRPR